MIPNTSRATNSRVFHVALVLPGGTHSSGSRIHPHDPNEIALASRIRSEGYKAHLDQWVYGAGSLRLVTLACWLLA